jgi:putative transposase
MPDTFSQIYIQFIFAVQNRKALLHPSWEEDLYKYMTGIVRNKGQKVIAINGTSDHIHILIGMRPNCCLSDLVRELKKSSNALINERKLTKDYFRWQEGFGAFSYNHSQVSNVANYIANQKELIKRATLKKNISNFSKFLTLNLIMNICLNG